MRDFRKHCRPKTTKNPQVGDIKVKLKCGNTVYVKVEEYKKVKEFFKDKNNSVIGESTNSVGNLKVLSTSLDKEIYIEPEDYVDNLDLFEFIEIVGEKIDPFNGYDYVDLGLPSGTLWATMNVGAVSETDIGEYYKFGETSIYDGTDYNTSNYTLAENLSLENDAANANLGGDWHIPTKTLWDELINNTTHTYISDYNSSGVNVFKFAKTNDSSTFIIVPTTGEYTDGELHNPNTGYYWASTQHYKSAYYTVFTENSYFHADWTTAYGHGFAVRAVCDSVNVLKLAQEGDIICYNLILQRQAIFSYNNWLNLDESWDATGLYGIETFNIDDEVTEQRYVIMANGTTFTIKAEDYSKVNSEFEIVDTINFSLSHDYVEIGGIKWATMNVGANSPTDTGLYFQWGDIQGYTAAQVGNGEGQKYFRENDDIYYNDGSFTKYNEGDSLITLESTDDAVKAAWGGNWRMPTVSEFIALGEAVDAEWTADYQGSGVAGLVCTDKTDSSKTLFFPACGNANYGIVHNVDNGGFYWSSSLLEDYDNTYACHLYFCNDYMDLDWESSSVRYYGYPVRGILDE